MISKFSIYNKRIKCYNTLENRILGAYRCSRDLRGWKGNGVWISDRTAAVKWSCKWMPLVKTGKAFAALKLSQKTCLLSNVSDSSGSRMIGSFKISGLDIWTGHDWTKIPICSVFLLPVRRKSPAAEGMVKLNIWVFSAHGNTICGLKGNQVQILNDPVTVSGETGCSMSLCETHEKAQPMPKIRKSGSLLKIKVHSFRRKWSAAISHNGLVLMYVCFFGL